MDDLLSIANSRSQQLQATIKAGQTRVLQTRESWPTGGQQYTNRVIATFMNLVLELHVPVRAVRDTIVTIVEQFCEWQWRQAAIGFANYCSVVWRWKQSHQGEGHGEHPPCVRDQPATDTDDGCHKQTGRSVERSAG